MGYLTQWSGKNNANEIINQITGPDSGEIFFDNEKLNKNHIFKIGYMPEERFIKKMKVGEQALYLAQLKGMRSHEAIEKLKFGLKN